MRNRCRSKVILWTLVAVALFVVSACAPAAPPAPTPAPKTETKTEAPKTQAPKTEAPKAAPEATKAPEKAATPKPAAAPAQPMKIRMALLKGTQLFPILAMEKQGIDKKYNIVLEKKEAASPDAINIAVRSKEVDAAFNGWTETIKFRAQGVKVINAYPLSAFVNAVVVKNDSPMKSLADVKGKVFGSFYNPGTITASVLRVASLKYHGFDPYKDTDVRQGAKPLLIGFLDKGEVQAIYMGEPDISKLLATGKYKSITSIAEIYKAKNEPVPLQLVLQVQEDFAEKNPQAVKALAGALQESIQYLKSNPAAWPALAKEVELEDPKAAELLRGYIADAYFGKPWDEKFIEKAVEFGKEVREKLGPDQLPEGNYKEGFSMKYLP